MTATTPTQDQVLNEPNTQEDQTSNPETINASPETDANSQPEGDVKEVSVNYKEKFTNSSKEAIRLHKENKKIQEELVYAKKKIKVASNPELLHEVYDESPELADRLAADLYDWVTYKDLLDDSDKEESTDVRKLVRQELEREKKMKEEAEIEDYEEEFFARKEVLPGSDLFKKIMKTYSDYTPTTKKQAQQLLNMAHQFYTSTKSEMVDLSEANTSFSSQTSNVNREQEKEFQKMQAEMSTYGITLTKETYEAAKRNGTI